MNSLFQKAADNQVVLIFDEFGDFLLNLEKKEGMDNVRLFLAYMRELRDERDVRMVMKYKMQKKLEHRTSNIEH